MLTSALVRWSVAAVVGTGGTLWLGSSGYFSIGHLANFRAFMMLSDPEIDHAVLARLRAHALLDNASIALLNPNASDAEHVFTDLLTWFEQNAEEFVTAETSFANAEALYRRTCNAGACGGEHDREAAREAVDTARTALDAVLASARSAAFAQLSEGQTALAGQMWANRSAGLEQPLIALELTTNQARDARQAMSSYASRAQLASSREARAALLSAAESALNSAIGGTNVTALETIRGYWGPATAIVSTAEAEVLQPPNPA